MRSADSTAAPYYVRSSALGGQILVEVSPSGQKLRSYIFAGSEPLATQEGTGAQVRWEHRDPTNVSVYWTNASNVVSGGEYDPLGVPAPEVPGLTFNNNMPYNSGSFSSPDMGCTADRIPTPCSLARKMIAGGIGVPCKNNDCGPQWDEGKWQFPHYTSDGLFYGGVNAYPGGGGKKGDTPYLRDRKGNPVNPDRTTPQQRRTTDSRRPYKPEKTSRVMDVGFHPDDLVDCNRFADIVQEIANESGNAVAFLDKLAKSFTGAEDSSVASMITSHDLYIDTSRLTDKGFKSQFREVDNEGHVMETRSQARHFVAALVAAYRGDIIGTAVMDGREAVDYATGDTGSMADVNLNHAASGLSSSVGRPAQTVVMRGGVLARIQAKDSYKTIAEKIRKELCEP